MQQIGEKVVLYLAGQRGTGDPLEIVQEIEIWSYK